MRGSLPPGREGRQEKADLLTPNQKLLSEESVGVPPGDPGGPGGSISGSIPRLSRVASLTFARRAELDWLLMAARGAPTEQLELPLDLSLRARSVAEALVRRGASFFSELVAQAKLLPTEVEDALWELLARGLVSADAVENLRVLQSPKRRKRQKLLQRGGPGRWSLLRASPPAADEALDRAAMTERLARLFLRRYGMVWRDLVAREPLCPPWRELSFVYRRMEARGEVRGGRFAGGVVGEQFALPEAVDMARSVRREQPSGKRIEISAVDPLNLTGVVTAGRRVAAVLQNRIVYIDGVPESEPVSVPIDDESLRVSAS
jgi:ATP-dependent Lhr-like helicase